jgi:spore maturation protein CgeB
LTEKIAPHFDYNLHAEKDAEEKFKAIGANTVWFPMAANPRYYHPIKELKREIDVLFIGVNYAKRAYYIWHLLENGVDVHVYGPEWRRDVSGVLRKLRKKAGRIKLLMKYIFLTSPSESLELSSRIAERDFRDRLFWKYRDHMHPPPISDEEMIRKYSESKISLGFLEVYDHHDPSAIVKQHLHLREFEAPMSGALYFTNYYEELAEFYKLDKEVVVYRNEHELLDKVKYYLSHPNEAEKIRKAGHKRAISCHTYQKRFEELFKTLGI